MLETIRNALRFSSEALDDEIQDTIDACYKDMQRVGIEIFDEEGKIKESVERNALIIACQKQYARWMFNFENAAERYRISYESMRDGISLCGDYHV